MFLGVRSNADAAALLVAIVLHAFLLARVAGPGWRRSRAWRAAAALSILALALTSASQLIDLWRPLYFPGHSPKQGNPVWWQWMHGVTLAWGFALIGASGLAAIVSPGVHFQKTAAGATPEPGPAAIGRRRFLALAGRVAPAAPLAIAFTGAAISRFQFELTHVKMPVPNLPPELAGFRIAHLSDPHLGAFLDIRDLERMVQLANETRPHLAAVTGDLITGPGDPLDAALAILARLQAEHGIVGCHGNHEIYAAAVDYASEQGKRHGITFLRRQVRVIRQGSARLAVVGVDYQPMGIPYLRGVEALSGPGVCSLLLSHNPDVYPVAARKGFAAVLAGHTHGGQVNFEILGQDLNVARFVTPYTRGLYTDQGAALYVNRGIGTVGIPVRLGAAPEVALIELCAT